MSQRTAAGSLAILTSPQFPNTNALNFFLLLVTSRNGERRDHAFVESTHVTQLKEKLFSFVSFE